VWHQVSQPYAFHKSNPSSVPQGIVDSYSILMGVTASHWGTWGGAPFTGKFER
jgi:hypothetical protein